MRRTTTLSIAVAALFLTGCHITANEFACNGPNECPSPYVCDETFHCSIPAADSGGADSGSADAGEPFDAGTSDSGPHDAGTDAGTVDAGALDGGCSCGTDILNGTAPGDCILDAGNPICICNTGFDLEGNMCVDACSNSHGGCGDTDQGVCSHNASTNAVICACYPGFENMNGSGPGGTSSTCVADPCAVDGGACGAGADTVCGSDGGVITGCYCATGYSNVDGGQTAPCVDTCSVNNGGCGTAISNGVTSGSCVHAEPSFAVSCVCNLGFELDGGTCVDQCPSYCGGSPCSCSHAESNNMVECACP